MANHCYVDVIFSGAEKDILKLEQMMLKMQADESATGLAQCPDFFTNPPQTELYSLKPRRHGKDYCVSYITNYLPNVQDVLWIAVEVSLSFVFDAVEPGMCIYQTAIFEPGKPLLVESLEPAEYAGIDYDPKTKESIFEGKRFPDTGTCVRSILDAKLEMSRSQRWL